MQPAYFTIYAYDALRAHLDQIDHLDFLFGEPRFISSLDPDKTEKKSFKIEDELVTWLVIKSSAPGSGSTTPILTPSNSRELASP